MTELTDEEKAAILGVVFHYHNQRGDIPTEFIDLITEKFLKENGKNNLNQIILNSNEIELAKSIITFTTHNNRNLISNMTMQQFLRLQDPIKTKFENYYEDAVKSL